MDIPIVSYTVKPTVFISSQIKIFSEERKVLKNKIFKQFGWQSFVFEDVSRPYPARDTYKAGIEQSNIFIGIYGTEYGWIDEDAGMGISGLHDEWLIATKNKMRRLAFTKETDEPVDPLLAAFIEKEVNRDITSTPFSSKEELYDKVIESLKVYISDCIFAGSGSCVVATPNYSEQLIQRYNSKHIVETDFFRDAFMPCIERNSKVYLYGEPGQGKTVSLMLMMTKKYNSIYISLRNRSSSYVIRHIINSILISLNKQSYNYTSINKALTKCEQLLREHEIILAIDDTDQNIELARLLLGLETGKSKIVFAGRKQMPNQDYTSIQCVGFTLAEAEGYISAVVQESDSIRRSEAIKISNGNPQYLTYYCNSSDKKPADSLRSYHRQIYDQMSVQSKEILAVLSFSEIILSVDEVAKIISRYRNQDITGIALAQELSEIDFLVTYEDDLVAILHPAFSEYVCQCVTSSGVSSGVHKAISDLYIEPYEMHFKIYHLVCAGEGETVYADLPNAALNAYLSGFISIARKIFAEDILLSRREGDLFRLGYALHHTALLKKDQFGEYAGLRTIVLAEKIFEKAGKDEWSKVSRAIRATFLVENDRGYDAINMLKSLASHYQKRGLVHQEAVIRTNLSYVYQRLGLMDKVESEALRAKKIHQSIGDDLGVATCLVNINSVYIARGEYDQIIKTCREIQELAKKLDSPRMEAAAQNGLTAYYRRKKIYDKAETAARKSISLAKELNSSDLVAVNYGNLGNIYRDQGRIAEAKDCHEKVLEIAQRMKSKHHIAHAKGRLAELFDDEDDGDSAIQYGNETIAKWKEIGNVYELASESCKQAERILKFSGFDWGVAVKLYDDAINYYLSAGLRRDVFYSYRSLIDICLEHLDRFLAVKKLSEALTLFSTPDSLGFVNGILCEILEWDVRSLEYLDVDKLLQELLKCISGKPTKSDLFDLVRNLTALLKKFDSSVVNNYLELVEHLILIYHKDGYCHYITALALVIDQIPVSIESKQLTCVFGKLNELAEEISFRCEGWLGDQWFVFFDAPNAPALEIRSGDTINERVVTALVAILTFRQKKKIEKIISSAGWKRIGLLFHTFDETDFRKHDIPVPHFETDWSVVIPKFASDEYRNDKFAPIIVSESYLLNSDINEHPGSRNIIGLNLQLVTEIIEHFTCEAYTEKKLKKFRTTLMLDVFDVTQKFN